MFFDAGDFGVVKMKAACKELEKFSSIGKLPTIKDIDRYFYGDYELLGWSTDSNAAEPNVTSETKISQDTTLYAVWKKK